MSVLEQTDGFEPNKQTPRGDSALGSSSNPFATIVGTTVSGTTIGAGSNLYLAGAAAAKVFRATGQDFTAATKKSITHGLNTLFPIVKVYGSGTNQEFGFDTSGNVTVTKVTACSGSTVNIVDVTVSATIVGATVVVIG